MKNWGAIPSHKELSADGVMSREEHDCFLRLCEVGETLALHLHSKPNPEKAEAALKELAASGHDVANDGSIFDCGLCWQEAKNYRK